MIATSVRQGISTGIYMVALGVLLYDHWYESIAAGNFEKSLYFDFLFDCPDSRFFWSNTLASILGKTLDV